MLKGESISTSNSIVLRPDYFISWFMGFFFSDLGSGGRKKREKKALKMTS